MMTLFNRTARIYACVEELHGCIVSITAWPISSAPKTNMIVTVLGWILPFKSFTWGIAGQKVSVKGPTQRDDLRFGVSRGKVRRRRYG